MDSTSHWVIIPNCFWPLGKHILSSPLILLMVFLDIIEHFIIMLWKIMGLESWFLLIRNFLPVTLESSILVQILFATNITIIRLVHCIVTQLLARIINFKCQYCKFNKWPFFNISICFPILCRIEFQRYLQSKLFEFCFSILFGM